MLLALFLLAFYKRKTFLIEFICSEHKFDTVTYSISDTLYRSLKTVAPILSSWYETGSKHVTSAKISNTKSSWEPTTAAGSLRSVLGLVLFNTFIKDPKGGAANPQHFGRWDKTGRSGWQPLVYFCHPQETSTGLTSGMTETSQCPDIFRKFPRTWQPLWAACASAALPSTGKTYFLMLRGSLRCSSLCPLPLVQSLGTTKNNLIPSPLPCHFRWFLIHTDHYKGVSVKTDLRSQFTGNTKDRRQKTARAFCTLEKSKFRLQTTW